MPDLTNKEKDLIKLIIKLKFFVCPDCGEEDYGDNRGHENHKPELHTTEFRVAHWFSHLDLTAIGQNLELSFLGLGSLESGFIHTVLEELVSEGFLTKVKLNCAVCGHVVYMRTDTMAYPDSVVARGNMCRFG